VRAASRGVSRAARVHPAARRASSAAAEETLRIAWSIPIGYHGESPSRLILLVPEQKSFHFSPRQSIALVFLCTLFGAAAQILIKQGANALASSSPLAMITNPPLVAGYSLYGLSTVLLVLALRDGELSILYPVISLTYVWVTLLSLLFLRETINAWKLSGIAVVVVGVALIGRNSRQ
jgi:multidrug transporter EmrE-like cation transporter